MDLCNKSGIVQTLLVLKILFKTIMVLIPIIITIIAIMDMINIVKSGEGEVSKTVTKLIKRLIAAFIVMMLPVFIQALLPLLLREKYDDSVFACMESATQEKVKELKEKEANATSEENNDQKNNNKKVYNSNFGKKSNNENNGTKNQNNTENNNQNNTDNSQNNQPQQNTTVGNGQYFDSNDVTKISGLSEQEFISVLQNSTAYKGKARVYIPYAKDLIAAERNHNVNAFYLIGLYSYESGWLDSELTRKCNNIGGVRYYSQQYKGQTVANCGGYAGFSNISDFIDFHANLLQTKYLSPGGSHYHGTSVASIAQDYGSGRGIDTIIRIATNVSGGNLSQ
jgi:beta-N-acetylglucosaminidase